MNASLFQINLGDELIKSTLQESRLGLKYLWVVKKSEVNSSQIGSG